MNEDYNDMYGGWEDQPIDNNEHISLLDNWFQSKAWKSICKDAYNGDRDSEAFMEDISNHLCNLIFHMEHDSPKSRVDYELNLFHEKVKDFMDT